MSKLDMSGITLRKKEPTPEEQCAALQNAAETLTANIRFVGAGAPIHSVCVTASTPDEGASVVARMAAEGLAAQGGRVLLVDADLRGGSLAAALGVDPGAGLRAVLDGRAGLEEAAVPTEREDLLFLGCAAGDEGAAGAGAPTADPVSALSSERFRTMLKAAEQAFDYVVVDTSPVSAYVDAAMVASLADATVLVVRHDYVWRDVVAASVEQLRRAHANLIGTVYTFYGPGC